jgi:hypothetical protein
MANTDPKKEATPPESPAPVTSIQKPAGFSLDRFKSKRAASVAGLDNLVDGMPHMPVGQVKDFFRVHPSEEEYWSSELCFVPVPIKGQKRDTIHLIDEDLAMDYLPSGKIKRSVWYWRPSPSMCSFSSKCRRPTWTTAGTLRPFPPSNRARRSGRKSRAERKRVSTRTRSIRRAARRLSRNRAGRNCRWRN